MQSPAQGKKKLCSDGVMMGTPRATPPGNSWGAALLKKPWGF